MAALSIDFTLDYFVEMKYKLIAPLLEILHRIPKEI